MTRSTPPFLLVALVLSGCAAAPPGAEIHGDNTVFVAIPTSRLELPEPAPRRYGAGFGAGSLAKYDLTTDQINRSPAEPRDAHHTSLDGLARLDWQVDRSAAFSILAKGDEVPLGQVKWTPWQPGAVGETGSLAFTAAFGMRNREFSSSRTCGSDWSCSPASARTEVRRSLADAAVIFGHRLNSHRTLFGGPFYTHVSYDVSHFSDRGSAPDTGSTLHGSAQIAGVNLGIAWRDGRWVRLLAEVSYAEVDFGSTRDHVWHAGLSNQFSFGPRTRQPPLRY